jgi:hypothetical protein
MESEQKPVVKWIFDKSFRPAVFKTLSIFIQMDMQRVMNSIKSANYIPLHSKFEIFSDMCKQNSIKAKFIQTLEKLKNRKPEIIAEIIDQQSLNKNQSEITDYYDLLDTIFDEEYAVIYDIIIKNQYKRFITEYGDLDK